MPRKINPAGKFFGELFSFDQMGDDRSRGQQRRKISARIASTTVATNVDEQGRRRSAVTAATGNFAARLRGGRDRQKSRQKHATGKMRQEITGARQRVVANGSRPGT